MNGKRAYLTFVFTGLLGVLPGISQEVVILGQLMDRHSMLPLEGAFIMTTDQRVQAISRSDGTFSFTTKGDSIAFRISGKGYPLRTLGVVRDEQDTLRLGTLLLDQAPEEAPTPDNVLLTAEALQQSQEFERGIPMLQAGRDVFQNRAAFDFSAAFFRPRGFDSRESEVYFNGFSLNRLYDGRPSWSALGGLTDIGRNRQGYNGWEFSPLSFGRSGGVFQMRARPATLREGIRLTASASNRTYALRQMATYNSGIGSGGHGILVSLANRFGRQGFLEGTPYASRSGFLAWEWKGSQLSILAAGLYSSTARGPSAALTRELVQLAGRRYNPYWGFDRGNIRNARQRRNSDLLALANATWEHGGLRINAVLGYHKSLATRGRLAYFDAPNPDPAYYRNLPSYYYNRSTGVNFTNVGLAAAAFRASPQIDWAAIYAVNRGSALQGLAAYLLTENRESGSRGYLAARAEIEVQPALILQAGIEGIRENLNFDEQIRDMLGAQFHLDRDPFTDTRNDMAGPEKKQIGDPIGYRYRLQAMYWRGFLQMRWDPGPFQGGVAMTYGSLRGNRIGKFRNARYPDASYGPAPVLQSRSWGIKAALGTRSGPGIGLHLPRDTNPAPPGPGRCTGTRAKTTWSLPSSNHRSCGGDP